MLPPPPLHPSLMNTNISSAFFLKVLNTVLKNRGKIRNFARWRWEALSIGGEKIRDLPQESVGALRGSRLHNYFGYLSKVPKKSHTRIYSSNFRDDRLRPQKTASFLLKTLTKDWLYVRTFRLGSAFLSESWTLTLWEQQQQKAILTHCTLYTAYYQHVLTDSWVIIHVGSTFFPYVTR